MLQNIKCQNHGMKVIKGCTNLDCDQNIFLCNQCVTNHPHDTDDINEFSRIIGNNLKETLSRQKLEWIKFNSDEQNKQLIQVLQKENNFQWMNTKIDQFKNKIKERRKEYIKKLTKIVDEILEDIERYEIKMFEQSTHYYEQKCDQINKTYELTLRYIQNFYQFQCPFVFQNKILSQDNPEKYIQEIKQLKDINLQDLANLRNQIKEVSAIKQPNMLEFEQLLPLEKIQEMLKQQNRKEQLNDGTVSQKDNDGTGRKPPEFETKFNKLAEDGDGQKAARLSKNKQQQIDDNPKQQNVSAIILENIRYKEIKPSLFQGQGVKFMIFLQEDLMIYGTETKLFSLKNTQQLQQIPLQISSISYLERLDNNSFIVGGFKKQGEGIIFKYQKTQQHQFQSQIIQQVQGDILTILGMNKDSIAFITSEKQNNKEIKYTLYYSKYLGVPNQFSITQDLDYSKNKKKIKIYSISDSQFCLHLINEYIALIQINEINKIFEKIKKIECNSNGSVIPLINNQLLFSTCVGEEKIEKMVIDLNDKVKVEGLTGEYVWQTKSNIFENHLVILQITEKGKLFLDISDKFVFPIAIQNSKLLGQLEVQLEQSSNYNLLVHFMEDQLYVKDEKSDTIKIYKIQLKQ